MTVRQCMGQVPFLPKSDNFSLFLPGKEPYSSNMVFPLSRGAFLSPVLLGSGCGMADPWLIHPAQIHLIDRQIIGYYSQGAEEPKLKWEHITTLVASLGEFVRSTDRKIIATTLSKLKLELDFDSHGISQVQVVLFGFQDAVSMIFCPCFPADSSQN